MAGTEGRSLELYFIDGKPDGMLTAEVFNWTGHVLMAPRTQIGAALARKEAKYTGVYILLGEQDGSPCAYIGEGEDISYRIKNHDTKKDWWTSAVLVTSAANNLHKAHVQYLEARLIEAARSVGKVALDNGNTPGRSSLSEAAVANMESFLEYLFLVLPALRVDMFLESKRPQTRREPQQETGVRFEMASPKHGIRATASLEDGEFVVLEGSTARSDWLHEPTRLATYGLLHEELKRTGVLLPQGECHYFTTNYAFKSPSAAAAIVNARQSNGPSDWKVEGTLKTYRQWEAEQLATNGEGSP